MSPNKILERVIIDNEEPKPIDEVDFLKQSARRDRDKSKDDSPNPEYFKKNWAGEDIN